MARTDRTNSAGRAEQARPAARDDEGGRGGDHRDGPQFELWNAAPFPVPDPAEIDEGLRAQLGRFRAVLRTNAPDGAVLVFLRCWVLLYGAVSMEVFGHLGFALNDPAPMFEYTLADLTLLVGREYPLPAN